MSRDYGAWVLAGFALGVLLLMLGAVVGLWL